MVIIRTRIWIHFTLFSKAIAMRCSFYNIIVILVTCIFKSEYDVFILHFFEHFNFKVFYFLEHFRTFRILTLKSEFLYFFLKFFRNRILLIPIFRTKWYDVKIGITSGEEK